MSEEKKYIYCTGCKHRTGTLDSFCAMGEYIHRDPFGESVQLHFCCDKNKNNDCPDFEKEESAPNWLSVIWKKLIGAKV